MDSQKGLRTVGLPKSSNSNEELLNLKPKYALSIKQPWSWLICAGFKDIENRTWQTQLRGRVYVHTGKLIDDDGWCFIQYRLDKKAWATLWAMDTITGFALGAIIGEVDIIDCKFRFGEENENLYSKWHIPGQYGFILANPVLYETPIPMRGKLGFFEVDIPGGTL